MLFLTNYVSLKILRSIYFVIFESYLSHCSLIFAQNVSTIQRIVVLQRRLLGSLIFNQGISISATYLNKAPS